MDDTLNSEDEDTFLGAAMLVLMDFPNYVIISAYMLLAVVWAEAFLQVSFLNHSIYVFCPPLLHDQPLLQSLRSIYDVIPSVEVTIIYTILSCIVVLCE